MEASWLAVVVLMCLLSCSSTAYAGSGHFGVPGRGKEQVKPTFASTCDMKAITFRKRMLIPVAIVSESCGQGVACRIARNALALWRR